MTPTERSANPLLAAYQSDAADNYQHDRYRMALQATLSELPVRHLITFALACAERCYPYFEILENTDYHLHFESIQRVLDRAWLHVLENESQGVAIDEYDTLLNAIPFEDPALVRPLLNAVGSVQSALYACRAEPHSHAVNAAKSAVNATYTAVVRQHVAEGQTSLSPRQITQMNIAVSADPSIVREISEQQASVVWLTSRKYTLSKDDLLTFRTSLHTQRK